VTLIKWIAIAAVSIAAVVAGTAVYYAQPSAPNEISEQQVGEKESGIELVVSESKSTGSSIVTPNPYVKEFQLLRDIFPNGILVDSNGTVWTVGARSNSLIAFDPEQKKAMSYPIPSGDSSALAMVWTIEEDGDGSVWFSGSGKTPLWRFDPQTERFDPINSLSAAPIQMKLDDGRIWYASLHIRVIGVVQKEGQEYRLVEELDLGNEAFPSGIYVQNNTLWITQSAKITVFNITTSQGGTLDLMKAVQFPEQQALFSPTDIIVDNDSAWVTEHNTSFLTEYNFKTQELRRYPTALHPIQISTLPYWLAQDPIGEGIWFNEHRGNRIAFFDFSTRTLTEYEVPTRDSKGGYIANVLTVASDPTNEDRVWFTELTEDKIGYVDRSVPIPYDISTPDKQIVVEEGQTAQINIEVTRNPEVQLFNNTLSFNVSSSATISGVLLNATASFSPNAIDLSKMSGTPAVTLDLKNEGISKGNHTLAVSATDGAVIRTIYVKLEVR
jgi:virginiamycin B lyase